MARREWAEKIVAQQYGHEDDGCIAGLLRKEHARAVRIVKREIRRGTVLGSLDNVLAALMKGRT